MANIKKYTDKIRKSIYGKEVRGSLADGIEAINDEVEDNTEVAVNIEKRQDAVEQQFDDLQQNYTEDSPSDAEIVAGRTNTKTGKNYSTLGKRLDDEYEETHRKIDSNHDDVTAQLAEKASQSQVNKLENSKADIVYVDDLFTNLDGLEIKGGFDTVEDLENAYPDGTTGLYVVDDYLYGWNGNEWKDVKKLEVLPWAEFMTSQDEEWVV